MMAVLAAGLGVAVWVILTAAAEAGERLPAIIHALKEHRP